MPFDYYVRADGTAGKDDATGPPSDPSKAMSLETFNASSFAPGDRIGFSDQGGDFQGQLVVPSGGTADNPIVYAGVPGETPKIRPASGEADEPTVLVRNVSHVELENLSALNLGGSGVFVFDGNSKDVVVRDAHVLSNRSPDGSTGGDGFSLSGSAEVTFYDITARATGQAEANSPPESDQAITTHGNAKAWVYGFDFQDAESWAVAVGDSELYLFDGIARDAHVGSFSANGDARVEVHRSDIVIDDKAKFGSGGNQSFIDSDITITGGAVSLLTGQTRIEGSTLTIDSPTWRLQSISPDAVVQILNSDVDILDVKGSAFFMSSGGGSLQIDDIRVDGVSANDRFAQFGGEAADSSLSWIRNSEFSGFESERLIWVNEMFGGSLEISGNSFSMAPADAVPIVDDSTIGPLVVTENTFLKVTPPILTSSAATVADNIFRGDSQANEITATAYDDLLIGADGNDSLFGGDGDDSLRGGQGQDLLAGGSGRDSASYEGASQGVVARLSLAVRNQGEALGDSYQSIEDLIGSDHADSLYGSSESNAIRGGGGNDKLLSGLGNDSVFGEAGNDRYFADSGVNLFDGGSGQDIVDYSFVDGGVSLDLAAGHAVSGQSEETLIDVEHAAGSAANDDLRGDDQDNRLQGLNGDDLLHGRSGEDTLHGGAGDDSLSGGTDADELFGGGGSDTASYANAAEGLTVHLALPSRNTGEAAGDRFNSIENITGSSFNDLLYGDDGANVLRGGDGNDRLLSGAGNDQVFGEDGNDRFFVKAGSNLFDGGAGSDIVDYAFAADAVVADLGANTGSTSLSDDLFTEIEHLAGSTFDDSLTGNSGSNRLHGNAGNDLLQGGAGKDSLFGGAGNDRFVFAVGDGDDTIWDFGVAPGDADLVVLVGFDQGALGGHPVDAAEQVGNHVRIELGPSQSLVLRNFDVDDLSEDLFLFS